MTDLAARLREVIEERLRVAREAVDGPGWTVSLGRDQEFVIVGAGWTMASGNMAPSLAQYIAMHGPADAILAGERDLGVIERHKPLDDTGLSGLRCRSCYPIIDLVAEWPCTEWRALAKRYGVTE